MTKQHPEINRDGQQAPRHYAGGNRPANSSAQHANDPLEPSTNASQPEIIRVRKKRKKHMSKRKKIVLSIVFAVLAILVISGVAFALSVQQAAKNATDYSNVDIQTIDDAVAYSSGKTIQHNGHTYQLNENMVSVVFMGIDKTNQQTGGAVQGQADAVMVVALDTSSGKISIVSIPRDSMVDVDTSGAGGDYAGTSKLQICLAYNYGTDDTSSCQNVVKSVQRTMYSIPMKYYFSFNMDGIGAMCDAVDGVSLTALETIPDTNIVQGEPVVLFGNNAVKYVQWRDITVTNSPLYRQERQKQFVQALAQQVLAQSRGNTGNLINLYNTMVQYSTTNLGTSDFTYLASVVANKGVSNVSITSLQGTNTLGDAGYAEFNLDSENVYQTVLDVYYTQVS